MNRTTDKSECQQPPRETEQAAGQLKGGPAGRAKSFAFNENLQAKGRVRASEASWDVEILNRS